MSAPARTLPGDKGTTDRIEADDGAYWVRLVTRQALDREGAWMSHCVGDGDYDRLAGGEELTDDAIWSLRDADGTPRLTVQISADRVVSANGYRNHQPSKGAAIQIRHLMAAFAAVGVKLSVSPVTNIVLAPDGRTFRRDRVPADIQAALDAAERERPLERWRPLYYVMPYGQVMFGVPEIRTSENPRRPILGDADPFTMGSLTEALSLEPEPRLGLLMLEVATSGNVYALGGEGGPAYDVEVSAATAAGADIVSGEDYVVDHGVGIIEFKRDLRDVQVLWQQARSVAQSVDQNTSVTLHGMDQLAVRFEQERAAVRARRAGLFAQAEANPWDDLVCVVDTQVAP